MYPTQQGLYDPQFEHDSCGVGFAVNVNGKRSHQIVADGITILRNLVHRGAVGGDSITGDGAGLLLQLPHDFFVKTSDSFGVRLPEAGGYGVAMLFLPRDSATRAEAGRIVERTVAQEGGGVAGWRDVPGEPGCLGGMALHSMPVIRQAFVTFPSLSGEPLERKLYVTRRCIERAALERGLPASDFYVCSFSSRTITYKGMFVAPQLEAFYPDLADADFQSAFALVHQRYSTNTFPTWERAQPFRLLCHNGEINTLRGNISWMRAREADLVRSARPYFGDASGIWRR